jgi:polyhydroxybutyrate depolymerase
MKSSSHPDLSQGSHHSTMKDRFFQFAMRFSGLLLPFINRTNGTMMSRGRKRSYLLFVPESYNPATPTPLVISLHGFAEWPAHQMHISRWNDLARQQGFIVVYPCGTEIPLRWRIYGFSGSNTDLMEDVTFISDLIDKLETKYNLDPARIYVNGLSNGGGMAITLSCKLPERIAAVGSVSGAYPFSVSECQPSKPVPTILFHGTGDPIVPYLGGQASASGFSLPSIPEWVADLAQYNGCSNNPINLPAIGAVHGIQFIDCVQNSDVVFYTIEGGGHSWPGGGSLPKIIVGNSNHDIDATKMMWDFFCQHPLPEDE